jgi:hypothetical protein
MNKRNRRFEDHFGLHHQGCDVKHTLAVKVDMITSLMMKTEMVLETSVSFIRLTRLIAREDFIECCRRESFRSHMSVFAYTQSLESIVAGGEFISRTGEETYALAIYIKGILIFSDFTFTLLVILWQ